MRQWIVAGLVACTLLAGCGASTAGQSESPEEAASGGAESATSSALASFSATTATNKDFGPSDLSATKATLVVVWSGEDEGASKLLAELDEWYRLLPQTVQVVTFCTDYEDGGSDVLKSSGFTGTTVVSGDDNYQSFVDGVAQTPTAFVIGPDGAILTDPFEGTPNSVSSEYAKLLNLALAGEGIAIG